MKQIKYLIMDVDGTLTDGKVYIGNNGEIYKVFDIKDGYGIRNMLPSVGVTPVIITGRSSIMLEYRCRELGITELYQGISVKEEKMEELMVKYGCTLVDFAYIGDDINDYSCMNLIKQAGGMIGCPADAVRQVKQLADFISVNKGGNGAVREFIDWILDKG